MTQGQKQLISAFIGGLLFSVGLGISGMTQPQKVIGFLDFGGSWDPTLMGVIGGAVMVYMVGFRVITGRPAPLLAARFGLPTKTELDAPLVLGAVLFGLGWGISGFCPGPALVSLPSLSADALTFLVAMGAGMGFFRVYEKAKARS